jgi:DNA-binding transcriptional LysR family regulator
VPSLYESIIQRCRTAGFDPVIGLEVYLQQTIVNFVAEGLGIAFVPASMQRSQIGRGIQNRCRSADDRSAFILVAGEQKSLPRRISCAFRKCEQAQGLGEHPDRTPGRHRSHREETGEKVWACAYAALAGGSASTE